MNQKAIYRPLFLEAWKNTWRHKRLWLLGIFAAVMASGGLFESLSGSWQTALKGRMMLEQYINGTLPGYQWLVSYGRYLAAMEPFQQYLLSALIVLAFFGLVSFGALAQGAILAGGLKKTPAKFCELIQNGQTFFWRILGLDVLGKLGLGLVFLITVAPVAFLNPLPYGWHQYPPFISLVLFLAGAIFVTTLQMLSLAGVVRKHLNIRAAVNEAWDIFRLHLAVTFELGVLLFIISFLAALATLIVLIILALLLTLLFVVAILVSSSGLYLLAIFISLATFIVVALLAAGLLSTFQYTVWLLYFEEAGRFGIIPKIRRLLS